MTFQLNGMTYSYTQEMVETNYGPENRVVITDQEGFSYRYQEPMSTEEIIRDFIEMEKDVMRFRNGK